MDGNKRVAFAVVDVFLRINGYTVIGDSKVIYNQFIKFLERQNFEMEHLVAWLQGIVKPNIDFTR